MNDLKAWAIILFKLRYVGTSPSDGINYFSNALICRFGINATTKKVLLKQGMIGNERDGINSL